MKLLIKGGRILDPKNERDEIGDLLIEKGKIAQVGGAISAKDAEVIPAEKLWVTPGLIDMHVHFRQPGREYAETIASGSRAAVKGGFTAVCPMANTTPVADHRGAVEFILSEAKRAGLVHIYPIGSVTQRLQGESLSDMADLAEAGCVAFSDDGKPVWNSQVMRHALEYAAMFGLPIIAHEEDPHLFKGGAMHEGFTATCLGLQGIPSATETIMVARDIELLRLTGGKLHIAHVSSARSIELVRAAKKEGLLISCETAPHYLALVDEAVIGFDAKFKMNPPLRELSDQKALRSALKEGVIDCIASDHAPHADNEKDMEFESALFGIIGLESSLGVLMTHLIHTKQLTPLELIARMSLGPATVLNLPKGTLSIGADADVTLIDPEEKWTLKPDDFESKSRNSPFMGWSLQGRARMTIVEGRIVMKEGKIASHG